LNVPLGSLVLTLAQFALAALVVMGLFQRNMWGRISAVLIGVAFGAFCHGAQQLVLHSGEPVALFWARFILGLGIILLTSAHLAVLTLGRADPAGAVRRAYKSIVALTVIGAIFLLGIGHPAFVDTYSFAEGSYAIRLGGIGRAYLGFLLLGLGIVAFRLEATCRAVKGAVRPRLLWAALGIFGCAGYFSYLLTDGAVSGIVDRDALVASGLPLLLATVLLGAAQFRGSLAQAGVSVGRQHFFRSLTGCVSAGYIVTVLAAGYLAQLLGLRPAHLAAATLFTTTSTGLMIFLFSKRLRRQLLRFIDRNFSSERVDYRTYWLRASHELVSGVGAHALQERGTILFEDLFGSNPVTIYLARRPGDSFRMMHTTAAAEPPDAEMNEPIVRRMEVTTEPFVIQERNERHGRLADPDLLPTYVENEILLDTTEARVVAPLRTADRLIGFVTLGQRTTGERYSYEDLALLETVTLQLAGAIRGAWLTEDLGAAREMEVFSQWANVVLHDLKNFVSPLKLFLQNARRHMHNPQFREQAIDDIHSVVEKMDSEIQRLTVLRHGEDMSPTPTDLQWVLDSVVARSGVESRPGFHLERRYARLPAVTADPGQLDRVFSNLITNAVESMPNGGLLTIETSETKDEGAGTRWAVVRFKDTGSGMAPAFLRHRLFQPFATTKNKGWGLGLYQCRSIIEAHGGTLTASSQEGIGSEFKITLPLRHTARHTSDIVGPGSLTSSRSPRGQV
jgi:putative PEP-CTERM system histidine kinase